VRRLRGSGSLKTVSKVQIKFSGNIGGYVGTVGALNDQMTTVFPMENKLESSIRDRIYCT
jgi:hypothetical protein